METIKVACITWNVETTWPDQDLHGLLGVSKGPVIKRGVDAALPDVYIIGLQEVKSQPQNVIMDALFEEPWTNALREVVGPHNYVRVTGERLQGIVTNVFVKRHHLPYLRDIHTCVVRTGFGGLWGNKGASSIRFSLYGCSVCVVNCHLAPHDAGYKERVDHFNAIVDGTQFPVTETSNILYHDYVFWLGDLNFRYETHITTEAIAKHVTDANWPALADVDELKKAQKGGDAFSMFTEGPLTFPPTYKYLEDTQEYDLMRRPAWTDRILYQVHVDAYENVKLAVEQSSYEAAQDYTQSDHRPVRANYKVKMFANHEERCVHFVAPVSWVLGEGGKVKFTLDSDVVTSPADYIAVYKVDFTSVHQYVIYMYLPQTAPGSPQSRQYEFMFNDELLQEAGMYRLLYYSGKYSCYLGMSDPFPALPQT